MNSCTDFDIARHQVKDKLKDLVLLDIELRRNIVKNSLVTDITYKGCVEFECGRAFERMILSNALNINIKEILIESSKVTDELIFQYSLFEENEDKEVDLGIIKNKISLILANYNNKFNTIKYKLDLDKWHKTSMEDIYRLDQIAPILKENLDYKCIEKNA